MCMQDLVPDFVMCPIVLSLVDDISRAESDNDGDRHCGALKNASRDLIGRQV